MLSLEQRPNQNLILDRWHLGQRVYPQLYPKGRKVLSLEEFYWIDLFLLSRGAVLIHVTDDPQSIRDRVSADENSYLQPDDVAECVRLFSRAVLWSILPTWEVRTPFLSDSKLEEIANWAKSSANVASLGLPTGVIGDVEECRYLLVGDQHGNTKPPEAAHAAPFAPYSHASGHYLMQALIDLNWRDRAQIAITNSAPDIPLGSIWSKLNYPSVVALGTAASIRLNDLGIEHGRVPHPQWVRRFAHHRVEEYGTMIKMAAEEKRRVSWPETTHEGEFL